MPPPVFTIRAATIIPALLVAHVTTARADEPRAQIQADLGLSVICVGYEHPVAQRVTVFAGAGIFGTYFLPWFDRGDETIGGVGDVRVTWFPRDDDGRGLYITPYARAGYTAGDDEDTGVHGGGVAITGGVFVGYAFRLSSRLDLRAGAGGQYIYIGGDNGVEASTPFVALDITLGFRL